MATNLARRMVTEWGMSDKVGMVCYDLAHASRVGSEAFSEETSREIDAEVKRLVALSRDRALAILEDNLEQLHLLADTLLKDETLTGQEVAELLNSATPLRVCARAG